MLVSQNHRLEQVQWLNSPNHDLRPDENDVSLVVIHGISLPAGQFGGDDCHGLFMNALDCSTHASYHDLAGLEVAPHLLIDRQGEMNQYVAFNRRAWHAGESCWRGRSRCNDFAIGIELEGADEIPYSEQQYVSLSGVLKALISKYPLLSPSTIVGHFEIAPGRKTDPGPSFDWPRLFRTLV